MLICQSLNSFVTARLLFRRSLLVVNDDQIDQTPHSLVYVSKYFCFKFSSNKFSENLNSQPTHKCVSKVCSMYKFSLAVKQIKTNKLGSECV